MEPYNRRSGGEKTDGFVTRDQLEDELVRKAQEKYRVDAEDVRALVPEVLRSCKDLPARVEAGETMRQLQRTRAYSDAVKAIRRKVYYHLRRYTPDKEVLCQLAEQLRGHVDNGDREGVESVCREIGNRHASARERMSDMASFNARLMPYFEDARSLLDVGCGVYPLFFPFTEVAQNLASYVAADCDETALKAVDAFCGYVPHDVLTPLYWDIAAGLEQLLSKAPRRHFDLALMLKVVPVLRRRNAEMLEILKQVPADVVVITGSTRSMTGNRDITRREKSVLHRFAEDADWTIRESFICGEEVGLVLA